MIARLFNKIFAANIIAVFRRLFSQIINNCNLNINKTYISKEEIKKLSNSLDEFLNPNKINNIINNKNK